ncbi:CesT family type III secretion system chaperone [Aquabacterium sp.]|uniref:CesT family type III secretion system chaperone n=1 Tax=Aquabacterium sp. TaxID=1872578 RepID=UPI002C44F70A|nr:CesT family type III secretion system chaperone [Aquabacterium sp.]HSW08471.1 CesT family type III secretion system chaperone [Aquabacterium sp.]
MTPHPQLLACLQRKGLKSDSVRPDGRLTLALGDRARMQLQPLPGGGLLFEARIAPLPPAGHQRSERGERIDTLLRAGAARLRGHPQALVIDAEAEAFMLQQRLCEGLSPVAFDEAVDDFLKSVVFWKHLEAAR